jgi:outer membrane protein assembly factor BamB
MEAMKKMRLTLIFTVLAAAMVLSSCAGGSLGPSNWPGVLVGDEVAYLAQGNYIYAINMADGSLKWKFPTEKPSAATTFYAAPVMTPDGELLAASYDHKLYSLNPETGLANWTFSEAKDLFIASPLVTSKGIYAPNADGNLYAVDFKGNKLWSFQTEQHLWGTPISDENCGCIYLPGMDHKFYAVDASDGSVRWESEDLNGALIAQPVYSDGVLFIGTFANQFLALSAEDGSQKWAFDSGGWVFGSAVLANDLVIFGDLGKNLYALDAEDGTQVWKKELDGPVYSAPLVKDDLVYVTVGNQSVYAFNLEGVSEWSRVIIEDAVVQGSPVDGGELILVPTSNLEQPLVALNPNGTTRWVFSVPK